MPPSVGTVTGPPVRRLAPAELVSVTRTSAPSHSGSAMSATVDEVMLAPVVPYETVKPFVSQRLTAAFPPPASRVVTPPSVAAEATTTETATADTAAISEDALHGRPPVHSLQSGGRLP